MRRSCVGNSGSADSLVLWRGVATTSRGPVVPAPTGPLLGVSFVILGPETITASPPPTAAQNDDDLHETEVRPLPSLLSTRTGSPHELPLKVTAFPRPSNPEQKDTDGQDSERMKRLTGSILTGSPHEVR
jgi:hypothetical protein